MTVIPNNISVFFKKHIAEWSDDDRNDFFARMCASGGMEHAQYLLQNYNIDIHYKNDLPFIIACENGQIEMVKMLTSDPALSSHVFSAHAHETGLITACTNNHYPVVEYLHHITEHTLNYEYALRTTAQHGAIETASWLLKNIESINNSSLWQDSFWWACKNNKKEMVNFLINSNLLTCERDVYNKDHHAFQAAYNAKSVEVIYELIMKHDYGIDGSLKNWLIEKDDTDIIALFDKKKLHEELSCNLPASKKPYLSELPRPKGRGF